MIVESEAFRCALQHASMVQHVEWCPAVTGSNIDGLPLSTVERRSFTSILGVATFAVE